MRRMLVPSGHQHKPWFVIQTCDFVIFGTSERLLLVRQLMALGLGQQVQLHVGQLPGSPGGGVASLGA